MKTKFILTSLFLLIAADVFADIRGKIPGEHRISFVELLSRPKDFDQKTVRFIGFFVAEGNGEEWVFVSKDAARVWDFPSSVSLSRRERKAKIDPTWTGRYIEVVGVFHYDAEFNRRTLHPITNAQAMEPAPSENKK